MEMEQLQEEILKKLEQGSIDIVIGTHKLLQNGINFKNLGLLVIDEEHRFGVKQKEKLKALRSEVDILTLTATPITLRSNGLSLLTTWTPLMCPHLLLTPKMKNYLIARKTGWHFMNVSKIAWRQNT